NLSQQVTCDLRLPGAELEAQKELARPRHGLGGQCGDGSVTEAHIERNGIEPPPSASLARLRLVPDRLVPSQLLDLLLVQSLHIQAGAAAALAPSVSGVEREQPWVQLSEAAATGGACASRREHQHAVGFRAEHVHEAFAEIESPRQR